jgi:hypothetical protein
MSIIARRIRATPERSASDAWQVIVDLIAPNNGEARRELTAVEGIGATVISTETPKEAAIVVRGNGPRLRIYCLYDDEAISGDDANEAVLAEFPTDGDWTMSLPAELDDVEWIRDALAKKSSRVVVREKSETVDAGEPQSKQESIPKATINMEAFLRS